jgi:hypothetical protein
VIWEEIFQIFSALAGCATVASSVFHSTSNKGFIRRMRTREVNAPHRSEAFAIIDQPDNAGKLNELPRSKLRGITSENFYMRSKLRGIKPENE